MTNERMSYESVKVTRDEATELCVYHLRCAAALFQLVPDDLNASIFLEIERQNVDGLAEVDIKPAKMWADQILMAYDKMKERD
jgi:hypothetical protein